MDGDREMASTEVAPTDERTAPIAWRVRLADSDPWKQYVVYGFAFFALVMGTIPFRSLLLGIAGSVMILAATAEFWLGTVYKLDEEGASSRTGLSYARILWKDVKRAVVTQVGIKLSPLDESTRLAPFRGVFLRYGREDRVRIEDAVRTLGGKDVRFVGAETD